MSNKVISNLAQTIGERLLPLLREGLEKKGIKEFIEGDVNPSTPGRQWLEVVFNYGLLDNTAEDFTQQYIKPAAAALLEKVIVPKGITSMVSNLLKPPFGSWESGVVVDKGLSCRVVLNQNVPQKETIVQINILFRWGES